MRMPLIISIIYTVCYSHCIAQPNDTLISVHDPVIIRQDSTYYIYCTGWGISGFASKDMKHWKAMNAVFAKPPQWAMQLIPGFKGHIWAPDISYHNGQYYLYYAVSAFGKNTSAIGVATNKTLDTSSEEYRWVDHGKVIQSVPNRDDWNAIDPNLVFDEAGAPWLSFGSFWSGIKLVRLAPDLLSVAQPEEWYGIASRQQATSSAGDNSIEAPFIFRHGKYYYLFVSFGYCCRGEKSTYKMMVGRSERVQGPYFDKDSVNLLNGGGSLILAGDRNWYGAGHNAVASFNGKDYIVFHGYDAHDGGKPKLRIEELIWDNDWVYINKR